MARYIDAEKIKRLLLRKKFTGKYIDGHEMSFNDGIAESIFAIDKIPAADVAPVVHGKWKENSFVGATCSNCKEAFDIYDNEIIRFRYCPNCGAKMDRKDGDNNV